jgi:hypothetical protein
VRSPFRMVRPQTSQLTTSWTGRSSFFTGLMIKTIRAHPAEPGASAQRYALTASCSRRVSCTTDWAMCAGTSS